MGNIGKRKQKPLLIGIAGGSGAGKSWLADKIAEHFGSRVVRFSLDDFYRDRSGLSPARRARINFDNPRAVDWDSFLHVLRKLRDGKLAMVPCYDFSTHCQLQKGRNLRPNRLVIVDGLWLFRKPAIRKLFDMRVFVDCSTRERLRRRIARDCKVRGRTVKSVKEQFARTVEPMHQRYVVPQAKWAHVACPDGVNREEVSIVLERIRQLLESKR